MATPVLEKFTLSGALGEIFVDVRATDRRAPLPAVIILHGFKGFKDWGMFPPLAERLARAGFAAISLNVSGAGVDDAGLPAWPDRFARNTFSAEQADLDRLLDDLDAGRLGLPRPTSVGIVGHSRGGGMAVLFAGRVPRVGALVTWAAISHVRRWQPAQMESWRRAGRLDVVNTRTGQIQSLLPDVLDDIEAHADGALDIPAAAGRIAAPWLVIHGSADEAVPFAEADRLAAAARPGVVDRLTLPGAGHTFGAMHPFAGMNPDLERVFDRTIAHFGRALR